jgi:hypothetical protein
MSNIVPATNSNTPRRGFRLTERTLTRIDGQTDVGLAQIESQAELQAARVRAVAYVGKRAMHEVTMISQLEQQLEALVPMATSRLVAIGDIVALSAADVVADTVRRVHR